MAYMPGSEVVKERNKAIKLARSIGVPAWDVSQPEYPPKQIG